MRMDVLPGFPRNFVHQFLSIIILLVEAKPWQREEISGSQGAEKPKEMDLLYLVNAGDIREENYQKRNAMRNIILLLFLTNILLKCFIIVLPVSTNKALNSFHTVIWKGNLR